MECKNEQGNVKKKGEVIPLHAMEAHGRRGSIAPTHTSRHQMRWVVSVTPRPRFTPGERIPGTHWIGSWVGPRAGLDAGARRKILFSCRGSNPDRPARSQTPARKCTHSIKILARSPELYLCVWRQWRKKCLGSMTFDPRAIIHMTVPALPRVWFFPVDESRGFREMNCFCKLIVSVRKRGTAVTLKSWGAKGREFNYFYLLHPNSNDIL
jgi:hypothetical protein